MSTAQKFQFAPKHRRYAAPIRGDGAERIGIGHSLVDNCSFEQAANSIICHAATGGPPAFVITPNAQHVVLLEKNHRLREIYQSADLVVPDGISLVLAARLFGHRIPERIAGVDLFQRLCALAAEKGLRVFLLGGRAGSADLTAEEMKRRHPGLHIETYCPPMGFELVEEEVRRASEIVQAAQPDLLFVGLGAPKQEYWMYDHALPLGVPVSIGVGGTFEMVAGVVRRAPRWVQRLGLEWLHRFCAEPRRMWRRYLIGNCHFCAIVVGQQLRRTLLSAVFALLRSQFSLLRSKCFAAEIHEPKFRSETHGLSARLARLYAVEPE